MLSSVFLEKFFKIGNFDEDKYFTAFVLKPLALKPLDART
jgi:hypothetical protein